MIDGKYTAVSGCSGIAGLDAGFEETGRVRTVCYIERDAYCQSVLCERMRQGILDTAPIWSDFKTFNARRWRGLVDIFHAGIPCQSFSTAGKRAIDQDSRNLWDYMRQHISDMEPRVVVVENVAGLFTNGQATFVDPASVPPKIDLVEYDAVAYGLQIVGELQSMGYCTIGKTLSALEVGAIHKRERRFIIAYSCSIGRVHHEPDEHTSKRRVETFDKVVSSPFADIREERSAGVIKKKVFWKQGLSWCKDIRTIEDLRDRQDIPEPLFCGSSDGVPHWMDRIGVCGNAVSPQVACQIAEEVLKIIDGG